MLKRLAAGLQFVLNGLRAGSTRDFYDRSAVIYDDVCRDQVEGTRKLLAYAPGAAEVGLDIACGTGASTQVLGERCRHVIGIDFSNAMLARARERLPDEKYRFIRADFLRMPVRSAGIEAGVDLALCVGGLRHVPEGLEARFLEEVHRCLAPGGTLIMPVAKTGLLKRAYAACYNACMRKRGLDERVQLWTPEKTEQLLRQAGFEPRIERPDGLARSIGCYAAIGRKIFSPT